MPNKIVEQLIEEVYAIKADLVWIKKALWTVAGAVITFNVTLASGIIIYLLKR